MEDFHLLKKITLSGYAEKVQIKVKQMGLKQKQYVCLCYFIRTNIFLSLTILITYYGFLFSPSNKKFLELACFILWPLIMILNAKVVISFMEPSQQFAVCDLRLTSVRPGIYN